MIGAAPPIDVLLVDDHAVVRSGYRRLLEQDGGIRVLGEAADSAGAIEAAARLRPHVVVLDLAMPGSGIRALRGIREIQPPPAVLMFSMYDDPIYARQSLQAGAQGYLTKSSGPEALVAAVRAVAAGETWLDPAVAQVVAIRSLGAGAPQGSTLSGRELQVLQLLVRGHSIREIASELGMSAKTAANHQSALRQKLGADSAVKLLQAAARIGVG